MNIEPEPLSVRLRRASAAMRAVTARLRESFEQVEDALWDKAMRPVKVPLPKAKRQLRWDGEFLLVSVLGRRGGETGAWERLTVDVDEIEVMLEAIYALRGLIDLGLQVP